MGMWKLRTCTKSLLVGVVALAGACGSDAELTPGVGRTAACDDPGVACTWAGLKGETGYNGEGHHRLDTELSQVQDLLFRPDGTAWFTDFNNFLIRRVLPDDTVESVIGSTQPIFPGDGPLRGIPAEGAAGRDWQLNHPTNLFSGDGDIIYVVAWHNHKILQIDTADDNWVRVVSGSGAGFAGDGSLAAQGALFKQVSSGVRDEAGNIYLIDQQNQRIRKIDSDGMLSTIAGTGVDGYSGDGGDGLDAQFSWEYGSNPNPSGGLAVLDGVLYISDTENNRIRSMDLTTGIVETVAGNGDAAFSGDGGPAVDASLRAPRDLEIGPEGDLYVADTDNGAVRAINLSTGEIRTVVGTGELGLDEEEALLGTETRLKRPMGLSFDAAGNLYVMDTLNDRIVRLAR